MICENHHLPSDMFSKFGDSLLFNVSLMILLLFHVVLPQYHLEIIGSTWLTPSYGGNYGGPSLLRYNALFKEFKVGKLQFCLCK